MFDEAEQLDTNPYFRTKHESERVVREECSRPWRVYRPGIVVGDSRTGEIDKIDGPYYFFKLLQRARRVLPSWLPTIGVEGGEINIVPVDYVAAAIDHIAHKPGLDGRAFHLTDPNPKTAGEVINLFAKAADAPQMTVRLDSDVTDPATSAGRAPALKLLPAGQAGREAGARASSACPPACSPTSTTRPTSTRPTPQAALDGLRDRGAAAGELRRPASGTTGSATSTPTSSRTARSRARCAARSC